MVCAGLMEKIMSNHTSYSAAAMSEQTRELKANELDQIAGGTPSIPIPPPTHHAIGYIQVRFPPVTMRS
jgi:hypothetical protein